MKSSCHGKLAQRFNCRALHYGYAPVSLLVRSLRESARTGERQKSLAGAIDTRMKTFREWLAERTTKNEGVWLNDKSAVVGMSRIGRLPRERNATIF